MHRCHCGARNHLLHLRPRESHTLDAEVLVVAAATNRIYLLVGRAGADPIVVAGAHRLRQLARALGAALGEERGT